MVAKPFTVHGEKEAHSLKANAWYRHAEVINWNDIQYDPRMPMHKVRYKVQGQTVVRDVHGPL